MANGNSAVREREISVAWSGLLLAAPIVVLFAIYHDMLNAWWMADDSMHLLSVARYGILAHFYRPLTELELTPSNLTPWLFTSYGIDFLLGGLNPRIAYVHHLISWSVTLGVLAIALRKWLGPVVTALVLVWFILAVPTSTVVLLLCTRHYVEGLLFATLCVLAYRTYIRSGQPIYLASSAACYALAMTAKEIFVPLGPVLIIHHMLFVETAPAHPRPHWASSILMSRLRDACRSLWPYLALVAAYVLYRGYMLGFGRLLSGYSEPEWRTRPAMLLDFPAAWQWASHWKTWQSAIWVALVIAGFALWFARTSPTKRARVVAFGVAVSIAVLAPVYPVLGLLTVFHVNPHYLMLPLLAFLALAGWASRECAAALMSRYTLGSSEDSRLARWGIAIAITSMLVLLTIAQFVTARHNAWPWRQSDEIAQYRLEGQYELYSKDLSLIVDATGPTWYHFGLQQLRKVVLQKSDGPLACGTKECNVAVARQSESGGVCMRYFSSPSRLQQVPCVPESTPDAK